MTTAVAPASRSDITTRFARDTERHRLTVLHDDGLYRHLQFRACWWHPPLLKQQTSSMYRFDLITVPGTLIFQGDGESYVFSRIKDMFEFFRGSPGQINPQYWGEKLTDGRNSVMRYDQELLERCVKEDVNDALQHDKEGTLDGLTDAVTSQVLDELIGDESIDRDVVERFQFYADLEDQFAWPRKEPDFQFHDVWEWNCRDYHWWFLWACHGIVWGITQYDSAKTGGLHARHE
jgi:hypothetical protein